MNTADASKKVMKNAAWKKGTHKIQMNFNFSDDDDEEDATSDKTSKVKAKSGLKANSTMLAESSVYTTPLQVSSNTGLPDAESTSEVQVDTPKKPLMEDDKTNRCREHKTYIKRLSPVIKKEKNTAGVRNSNTTTLNPQKGSSQRQNLTSNLKEDKENEPLPDESSKQMLSSSEPQFNTILSLSCSLHDSSGEILATESDDDSENFPSLSREEGVDHISASDSDDSISECEDQPQKGDDEEESCSNKQRSHELLKMETLLNFDCPDSNRENAHSKYESGDVLKCANGEEQYNGSISPSINDTTCNHHCQQDIDLTKKEIDNSSNQTSVDIPAVGNVKKINNISVTEDSEEPNIHLRTIIIPDVDKRSIRNQGNESSDDDDNFDNFLNKVKKDIQHVAQKESSRKELPSLDVFIVDDDESEDSASDQSKNGSFSCDDDDELFYIKIDQKMERDSKTMGSDHSSAISADQSSTFKDDYDLTKQGIKSSRPSEDSFSSSDGSLLYSPSPFEKKKRTSKNVSKADTINLENSMQNLSLFGRTTKNSDTHSKRSDYMPSLNKTSVATYKPKPSRIDDFQIPITPKCLRTSSEGHTKTACIEGGLIDFKTPDRRIQGVSAHMMTAPRSMLPSSADGDKTLFLKSLATNYPDWKRHPEAQRFVKSFNLLKDELTSKLFRLFNEAIFETKLPETISLEWSTRYTKTAGTFSYRQRSSSAKITLSQKVCDSPERVRDTLAHELCHAAVRLINGVSESHGRFWKSWAGKINKTFPFMPLVARCHDYVINTKYTYQCVNCKYRVGRHSKSLDTDNKVCGHCHGRFELFLTKDLNSSEECVSYTPRAPNKFASYVKEHYSERKKKNVGMKHGEVMRLLSQEFAVKNKISDSS